MEVLNEFLSMFEFIGCSPSSFFVNSFITCPANQIEEFALSSTIYFGVEYFGNFIFRGVVNNNRRRRILDSIRDCVWSMRFKHRNMEYSVNCVHVLRQSKCEGV